MWTNEGITTSDGDLKKAERYMGEQKETMKQLEEICEEQVTEWKETCERFTK